MTGSFKQQLLVRFRALIVRCSLEPHLYLRFVGD
jgi:hypothetical protein